MRILAVEDDREVAALLHRCLTRDGHAVDVAGNATDGGWLAREHGYDAIVLDVNLPDADGFTLCRQFRDAGIECPVLLLTGRCAVEDRVRGLDSGADDYMVKPFSMAELRARLRALTRRGPVAHHPVIHVGSVRVEPARRLAWKSGVVLDLTPQEYALLELLARHGGAAVSRQVIRGTLWDFAAEVSENALDVLVSSLRGKLRLGGPTGGAARNDHGSHRRDGVRRPGGDEGISTVRGYGYRLAVD